MRLPVFYPTPDEVAQVQGLMVDNGDVTFQGLPLKHWQVEESQKGQRYLYHQVSKGGAQV